MKNKIIKNIGIMVGTNNLVFACRTNPKKDKIIDKKLEDKKSENKNLEDKGKKLEDKDELFKKAKETFKKFSVNNDEKNAEKFVESLFSNGGIYNKKANKYNLNISVNQNIAEQIFKASFLKFDEKYKKILIIFKEDLNISIVENEDNNDEKIKSEYLKLLGTKGSNPTFTAVEITPKDGKVGTINLVKCTNLNEDKTLRDKYQPEKPKKLNKKEQKKSLIKECKDLYNDLIPELQVKFSENIKNIEKMELNNLNDLKSKLNKDVDRSKLIKECKDLYNDLTINLKMKFSENIKNIENMDLNDLNDLKSKLNKGVDRSKLIKECKDLYLKNGGKTSSNEYELISKKTDDALKEEITKLKNKLESDKKTTENYKKKKEEQENDAKKDYKNINNEDFEKLLKSLRDYCINCYQYQLKPENKKPNNETVIDSFIEIFSKVNNKYKIDKKNINNKNKVETINKYISNNNIYIDELFSLFFKHPYLPHRYNDIFKSYYDFKSLLTNSFNENFEEIYNFIYFNNK